MLKINDPLKKLIDYVESKDYTGYDIYDGLKITKSSHILNNYFLNTAITQIFKKSPLNFRRAAGIKETKMPKGMGLFLNAYSNLAAASEDEQERNEYLSRAEKVFKWLKGNITPGYSGVCWNFGFKYKFMFDTPTVVITSIIAKGIYNYYKISGSTEANNILLETKNFILKDLPITETKEGICFSYTPVKQDTCYNANMLAAEALARIYSLNNDPSLLENITRTVDFTIAHQHKDGRWNYSINISTGAERPQIDFHQGYILESLYNIIQMTGIENSPWNNSLKKGAEFYYREQFFPNGKSKWRIPKIYPVDIHNQAQGIITFSLLHEFDDKYLDFAGTIAEWTIKNMQDDDGFFYYQIHKLYKNKIPYMRWGQAWMMVGLSDLITAKKSSVKVI